MEKRHLSPDQSFLGAAKRLDGTSVRWEASPLGVLMGYLAELQRQRPRYL